jgi:hypothetical protein
LRILLIVLAAAAIALIAAIVLLVTLSGGDDSPADSQSPTPTPTEGVLAPGQQSPNASVCTAQELLGTFVSSEGVAGHTIITLEVSHPQRACTFPGPPEVRWYDADGGGLGVPYTPNADCASGTTDYKTCVYAEPVDMTPANASPASAAVSAVRAYVSITNIGALPTCESGPKKGHIVGLQFPETPLDVQIQLPNDIDLSTCAAQVTLQGYGPSSGS